MLKKKDKIVTLEKIIKVSVPIFMKKGYSGTSIREIASKVGIKSGSLYYHIRDKEELLEKIHDGLIDELLAKSQKGIIADKNVNAKTKLDLFIKDALGVMAYFKPYATVFFRDYHFLSSCFLERIRKKRKKFQKIFQEILKEGIKSGEFRNLDVKITSFGIFGMFMWAHLWINPEGRLKVEEIAQIFSAILYRGICGNEKRGSS